jgi:WD40 repeat protein
MEALYDRIASEVAGSTNATDRNLAISILECVTCSLRVLTVAELAQALGDDASEMLDLQKSIADLCGGFVVVDNGGNVAMIHQTAREYLLSGEYRVLQLDRSAAHKRIFSSCMRCLTAVGLRAKVNRDQKPVFLDYAASSWSSHLTMTPIDGSQTWESLKRFLTSHWVLTWIHILAASRQLRVLVQASKNISKYVARRHESLSESTDFADQELLASWAIDFVKIVGKFGSSLRRNPESIYKLVPPFCPHNSAIYQLFGKAESKNLSVSGLSTETWDDALSRLSFGQSTYASSILAAGSYIAAIAASGTIYLYDSSTFEEISTSPITHGERVYRMELNSTATMLATYGYRTTKVWQVASGQCTVSVANPESRPRPLAMLFTNNSTMLNVGTDNKQVQTLDLSQRTPSWQVIAELEEPELEGHFLNAASHMALNKDGSLIAVAYRGHPLSAWEIDGPTHIGHCWRKREAVARGEVIEAVWHPYSPEVIGVYIEGDVFKWSPYEDDIQEIPAAASKLALSKDGNLFATGDVHGTVKVFVTASLSQIYQLASQDSVVGLAFSPDLCRFYDVRGYYANAWEPNALIRFAEQVGKDIDSESETGSLAHGSNVSVSSAKRIDSITVLAASPTGRLYCCGTELGTLCLYDVQRGKIADLYTSKSFFSIEQICWSDDGRYICFSDLSKRVVIMSVTFASSKTEPTVETVAEVSMHISRPSPILQLLFDPKANLVLVHVSSKLYTISLATLSVTQSTDLSTAELKWTPHPSDASLIIGFGSNTVRLLDWDLTEHTKYKLDLHNQSDGGIPTAGKATVDRVIVTHGKRHILVQTSTHGQGMHRNAFLYFETSSFASPRQGAAVADAKSPERETLLIPYILPQSLSSHIHLALAFLSNDRLVFLSKTSSLCSLKISTSSGAGLVSPSSRQQIPMRPKTTSTTPRTNSTLSPARTGPDQPPIKEYFPLPGDWIGRDSLALSRIWGVERSLLVPRNGEVAVVRCTALV